MVEIITDKLRCILLLLATGFLWRSVWGCILFVIIPTTLVYVLWSFRPYFCNSLTIAFYTCLALLFWFILSEEQYKYYLVWSHKPYPCKMWLVRLVSCHVAAEFLRGAVTKLGNQSKVAFGKCTTIAWLLRHCWVSTNSSYSGIAVHLDRLKT